MKLYCNFELLRLKIVSQKIINALQFCIYIVGTYTDILRMVIGNIFVLSFKNGCYELKITSSKTIDFHFTIFKIILKFYISHRFLRFCEIYFQRKVDNY